MKAILSGKKGLLWVGLIFAVAVPSWSQWTWPGCSTITDADFTYTTLLKNGSAPDPTLSEPDKIAFDMDSAGHVDVYFTEIRPGNIKRYSAATNTVKTLVKLPNWGRSTDDYATVKNGNHVEEGVTGIALDPNFKTNHYVYIHWSPAPATNTVFRVSRFTVTGDTILTSSEKVLLSIPAQRDECCHTGGAMDFDAYGDLWIAQGPNTGRGTNTNPTGGIDEVRKYESEEWGASSTHGMRGGILRIHPDNSERGYSIPSGNFGEYFAQQTSNSQYLDTSKVLPEIYIKGTRNDYSLSLDPVRRWVVWGDVGPDVLAQNVREELNLRKSPGFEGWPYFVGKNVPFSHPPNVTISAGAPANNSIWNTGLKVLPQARPAFRLNNSQNGTAFGGSPITGPIYRYDGDLQSTVKLPPHFTRKWFVTDHNGSQIQVLTLDSLAGDTVTKVERIFANHTFYGPVDFKVGPDGALYVVNYGTADFTTQTNTSIVKISYTGSCRPADPKLEKPNSVSILNPHAKYVSQPTGWWVNLRSGSPVLVPEGMSSFQIFDLTGRKVWEIKQLKPGETFKLPELKEGAFKYRWVSAPR